jgi:shikimate kinase
MNTKHLLLTGYRGCGKTTIGRLVSHSLALPFLDTDVLIEQRAGKSIADIFTETGEAGFRDLETAELLRLRELGSATVIALGGGAIIRPENRNCIRELGQTVWLQASAENIYARIAGDANTIARRPKLSQLGDMDEIRSKLTERWEWYREVANLTLESDTQPVESVAQLIVDWYSKNS